MGKFLKIFLPVVVVVGGGVTATVIMSKMSNPPLMFRFIDDKLKSIVTPKAPLVGNLTPTRDLRGTWKSSLSGKGLQVYGKFTTGPAVTTVYEDGDIELIIESVKNNIASGKIRYTNLCAWGQATAPKPVGTITIPKQCAGNTGYLPIDIRVSGSALDFGTVKTGDVTATMQGSYTTDLMSGTMTVTMPAYGALKGEFHLNRQK